MIVNRDGLLSEQILLHVLSFCSLSAVNERERERERETTSSDQEILVCNVKLKCLQQKRVQALRP